VEKKNRKKRVEAVFQKQSNSVSKVCSSGEGRSSQGSSWLHVEKASDGIRRENMWEVVVIFFTESKYHFICFGYIAR